ncbi:hypothetical protein C2G38_2198350, partial [Gigaspora rosea]
MSVIQISITPSTVTSTVLSTVISISTSLITQISIPTSTPTITQTPQYFQDSNVIETLAIIGTLIITSAIAIIYKAKQLKNQNNEFKQTENKITVITTDNTITSINASITWMNNIIIVLSASDKPFEYLIQTIQLAIVTTAIIEEIKKQIIKAPYQGIVTKILENNLKTTELIIEKEVIKEENVQKEESNQTIIKTQVSPTKRKAIHNTSEAAEYF